MVNAASAGGKFVRVVLCAGLVVLGVLSVGNAGGCSWMEPRIPSPYSGKESSAGEIAAERTKLEAEEKSAAAAKLAAVTEAGEKAKAEAKRAAVRIALKAKTDAASAEADLADLEAASGAAVAQATRQIAAIGSGLDARLAAISESYDVAQQRISEEQQKRLGVLKFVSDNPVVRTAAASVGLDTSGVGSLGALLLGAGGIGWMNKRAKAREDKAWDEADAKAKLEAAAKDAAWDEAQSKAVAAALQQQNLMLAMLGRFDTNKDGKLDSHELAAAAAAEAQKAGA